jgi:hypothetical protein
VDRLGCRADRHVDALTQDNARRLPGGAIRAFVCVEDGIVLLLGGIAELNTQLATPFCPGGLKSVERLHPAP